MVLVLPDVTDLGGLKVVGTDPKISGDGGLNVGFTAALVVVVVVTDLAGLAVGSSVVELPTVEAA